MSKNVDRLKSPLCQGTIMLKDENSLEPWHMAAETCAKTVRSCFKKGWDWLREKINGL